MLRRSGPAIAVAILIAGAMTFAQDQGRQEKIESTVEVPHLDLGSCGEDAAVIATFTVAITDILHKDKDGNVVAVVEQLRTVQPTIFYLGDPVTFSRIPNTKVAMGVPGETQVNKIDLVNGAGSSRGSIYQVTVPGYGRLFSETGLARWDLSTGATLFNRGHNDAVEQDVAALCDYLSGR